MKKVLSCTKVALGQSGLCLASNVVIPKPTVLFVHYPTLSKAVIKNQEAGRGENFSKLT